MSFRRAKQPNSSATPVGGGDETRRISGVKPWINGSYLVSTGNRDLDDLIGGGQGLGTALMVESDSFSGYGETVLSYGIAQALSSGHRVLVLTDSTCNAESFASTLPYNQNISKSADSRDPKQQRSAVGSDNTDNKGGQGATAAAAASENNPDDSSNDTAEVSKAADNSGLIIAWQYEKYVTKDRDKEMQKQLVVAEQSTQYCCSFDLSRRLQPSVWQLNSPKVFCVEESDDASDSSGGSSSAGGRLRVILAAMRAAVVAFLAEQHDRGGVKWERDSSVSSVVAVSRIFIPQLANLAANYGFTDESARQIVQFVLGIKQLVRDTHATVAFTLQPHSCPYILVSRLKWSSDTVLSVDSFAGREQTVPYEFKEFCGLLTVERVQQVGSIASFRPPGSKFGLKRDSRKLHIAPLHLPPEESRTGTAGTAAAAASAAKDGFAAVPAPNMYAESRGRIEIKMDSSIAAAPSSTSSAPVPELINPTAATALSHLRSPSKYEEKGAYDRPEATNGNVAARSIFARARAEGLLPGSRPIDEQRKPPLTPGSACGKGSSSSLDF